MKMPIDIPKHYLMHYIEIGRGGAINVSFFDEQKPIQQTSARDLATDFFKLFFVPRSYPNSEPQI